MKTILLASFLILCGKISAGKVCEYDVICSSQLEVVKVTVQDKIKLEGWQPLGPMTVTSNRYENQFMYCQTVVKYCGNLK